MKRLRGETIDMDAAAASPGLVTQDEFQPFTGSQQQRPVSHPQRVVSSAIPEAVRFEGRDFRMGDWERNPPGATLQGQQNEYRRRAGRRERAAKVLADVAARNRPGADDVNQDFLGCVDRGETWKVEEALLKANSDASGGRGGGGSGGSGGGSTFNINYTSHRGVTPLHLAGHPSLTPLLLRCGADPRSKTDVKTDQGVPEGYAQG